MPADRPRAGARGGQDQFSWEQVKEDKYRQHYLGASIHGVPERFKRGAEAFWYLKCDAAAKSSVATELDAIRAKESELMARLLGGESGGSATASARSLSPSTGPDADGHLRQRSEPPLRRRQRSNSPTRRGRHSNSSLHQDSRRRRSHSRSRSREGRRVRRSRSRERRR